VNQQTSSLLGWDGCSIDCGTFVVAVRVTMMRTTMDSCKKIKFDGIIISIISLEMRKKMYETI